MKKLILLCLAVLLTGCAATGKSSGGCTGPGNCFEAKRQLMDDAIHNRPFGP